jgi:3-dehydroquinate synthase
LFDITRRISVEASNGSYHVDFVDDIETIIKNNFKEGDFLVVDNNFAILHPKIISIETTSIFYLESSEEAKSYEGVLPLLQEIISSGFRRDGRLFAIGGGITQDAVSFIASILYRGVEWIFIPTTLLAQCDSCIGSKTSINFRKYKNQLGGFYPPSSVFINTCLLSTLGNAEIASGLGEMLHYFTVSSKEDFEYFLIHTPSVIFARKGLREMVYRCLVIKKNMVELDEFDKGPRIIFNYGHSFGHALESSCNYKLPHGIAISYGIDLANLVAVHLGLLDMGSRNHIRKGSQMVFEGFDCPDIDINGYFEALKRDKKNIGTQLGLILISDIGSASKVMVDFTDDLKGVISSFFSDKLYLKDL